MFKKKIELFIEKTKKLQGDPHYVALGMAIGIFIAITPTIPFHTFLAILLAFIFKASKPAAIIGVWVSNPFTVVFFYFACYKTGMLFFQDTTNGLESINVLIHHLESDIKFLDKMTFFFDFMKIHIRIFAIMNLGGLILGIPPGIVAYFLTRNFIIKIRKTRSGKKD